MCCVLFLSFFVFFRSFLFAHFDFNTLLVSFDPCYSFLLQDLTSIESATKVALETVRQDVNKMKQGCLQISNGIRLDQKDNRDVFQQSMGTFLERAQHLRDESVKMIGAVDEQFAALCSYFAAPPPPTTKPDEFFVLVASFVRTFTATVKQVGDKAMRKKKADIRNNSRLNLRSKASRRSPVDQMPPRHQKKLTGINTFDIMQVQQAAQKSVSRRNSAVLENLNGCTGFASSGNGSSRGVNSVGADVVLKAARRASLMMGVD